MFARLLLCLPLLAALAACDTSSGGATAGLTAAEPALRHDLGTLTYRVVDRMVASVPQLTMGGIDVVVGSVADVRDIATSSPMGNIVADMVRDRLVQRGIKVTEMRLRGAVLLDKKQGELALARDRRAVVAPPAASVVVAGTYAVGQKFTYISLKMIATSDAHILAAGDYAVQRQGDVAELLGPIASR